MDRRVDLRKIVDLAQMKFQDLKKLLQGTKDKKTRKAISSHMGDRHTLHGMLIEKEIRKRRNRRRNKIARQSRKINRSK
ncbi:unnamed protein product [marine sediment metagenome]|uniref:Uncharacterized protein n=1 Tax=marine sediment metagenome TaxID=412755 RepID=X1BV89_9ZZZZ